MLNYFRNQNKYRKRWKRKKKQNIEISPECSLSKSQYFPKGQKYIYIGEEIILSEIIKENFPELKDTRL